MFRMVKEFRSLGVFAAFSRWSLDKCAADVFLLNTKTQSHKELSGGALPLKKNFENPDETMYFVDFRQVNDEF